MNSVGRDNLRMSLAVSAGRSRPWIDLGPVLSIAVGVGIVTGIVIMALLSASLRFGDG